MEKETTKKEIELTDIVTGTEQAIKLPDESVVGLNEYLVWLGNQILEIKKAIA